ncbi:FAD-dependent oxidoreductase [Pseudonocardia sp. NPDC049635]|uniref:NAD(P)/FAD-dependent oxidoreductase n=1 Tax=Pseudonocardia sp. NPDC049635 TaxID=3155506 RepID=UPI003401F4A7
MTGHVVVVGGGHAGVELAATVRAADPLAALTILGEEPHLPYHRPPLSKGILGATNPTEDSAVVGLRALKWFEQKDIALRTGDPVVQIDCNQRAVKLSSGAEVAYDQLVLATGSRNLELKVPGGDLPGVHYLRTFDEAVQLRSALRCGGSVVVVGGGFIGLEIAACASKVMRSVTVVEAANRLLPRSVSEVTAVHLSDMHAANGVAVLVGQSVTRIIEDAGRAAGVVTSAGTVLPCDLVVVGIGVVPATELAVSAGLRVDNGVLVDSFLRTSDERISAIGDCAAFPSADRDGGQVRLESVQNAVGHARCLAARLTGTGAPYSAVPWFWTEQYGAKVQMVGLVQGHDRTVVRRSQDNSGFSVFCYAGERLLGVESVNRVRDHVGARALLENRIDLAPELAARPDVDLRQIAHSAPAA